ncbi:hypothetical protein SB6411_02331 [Klebsiella spallanzanii]|uniref:MotA/TolQ/ExbB proton channel domain-containing protein n=1 Tax=Klebsiella spallanzanii TaxID=2587528 RepID=A0ABY6VHJ0_9ENTR|nr:hypothetical protein [Klebsiella spallanzanii]VUS69576.1 hypothetical protein SB6411_02331 [Klebsiella spallanzanii]
MFLFKKHTSAYILVLLFFSTAVQAKPGSKPEATSTALAYIVPIIVVFGSLIAILLIRNSLPKEWSLADALSEDVDLPFTEEVKEIKDGVETVTNRPVRDAEGKPILIPVMKASSSRLIALMGMIVILFMFIGFGTLILFDFGKNGEISNPSSVSEIIKFLAAGMTLFAPYVVNKFTSLFQGLITNK